MQLAAEQYNLLARLVSSGEPVELSVEVRRRFREEDTNTTTC